MDYPIHRLVWRNDDSGIKKLLSAAKDPSEILEKLDPRGRTPLLLAIVLLRVDCVKVLLHYGANCLAVDRQYWSAMDEATTSGDPDLLRMVLQYRQYQLMQMANDTVPKVLAKLAGSPDFYVEMAWSFSSWIPFVSHLLPSDTYKIWKSATSVRVDTTLLGFENRKWKRGRLSLIFRVAANGAEIYEVNHDTRQYSKSKVEIHKPPPSPNSIIVPPDELSLRLTNPAVSTYVDVDAISFERVKTGTGFLGSLMTFGNTVDKVENVGGYDCKVYAATDVKLVSQKRTEHLLKEDKKKRSGNNDEPPQSSDANEHRLASLLSQAVKRSVEVEELKEEQSSAVTEADYFNELIDLGKRSLGRPREVTTKVQKFHATLWMSDQFPLSLQDQIMPIIDLLAQRHSHVKKLREFITAHLPAGFPVKIDLPLYYVITGTVQQMNVHGTTTPAEGVHTFSDSVPSNNNENRPAYETTFCAVDENVFEIPAHYRRVEDISQGGNPDFLSNAVESTLENHQSGSNSVFTERLVSSVSSHRNVSQSSSRQPQNIVAPDEEAEMQMAIAMSLQEIKSDHSSTSFGSVATGGFSNSSVTDSSLNAAMAASLREIENSEAARMAQEEADLAAALARSLTEK